MSEFVELGGYIVSGETLVYPDNTTMTGDGTVENPFGVKSTDLFVQNPLFTGTSGTSAYIGFNNETVLWSGSAYKDDIITLNENYTNFEELKFYWRNWTALPTDYINIFATTTNYFVPFSHWIGGGNYTPKITIFDMKISGDGLNKLVVLDSRFVNLPQTAATTAVSAATLSNDSFVQKIVGINHKV